MPATEVCRHLDEAVRTKSRDGWARKSCRMLRGRKSKVVLEGPFMRVSIGDYS
jgi:hypothetical protein